MTLRDFRGRTAVVTGAASGMGLSFAQRFAAEGMKVVLADIEEPALAAAVTSLRENGADAIGVRTDVSSAESIAALADSARSAFGGVHVLCNNAGVEGYLEGAIWEATPSDWDWTIGVDFWGVVHGIRTFVPMMIEQGEGGHVVNTASSMGLVTGANMYGIAKHAVVALSETLYTDLHARGSDIGVSVLCPGMVATQLFHGNRNRPEHLRAEVDAETERRGEEIRDHFTSQLQQATDPAAVAELVVDAIREKTFYVLTDQDWDSDIRRRLENILTRSDPSLGTSAYEDPAAATIGGRS